jgi:hypothetical protein
VDTISAPQNEVFFAVHRVKRARRPFLHAALPCRHILVFILPHFSAPVYRLRKIGGCFFEKGMV